MIKKIIVGIIVALVSIVVAIVAVILIMTPSSEVQEESDSVEVRNRIAEVAPNSSDSIEAEVENEEEDEEDSPSEDEEEADDKPSVEDIDIEIGNIFFNVLEHIKDMEESMTSKEVADFKKEFDMLDAEQKTENINHAVNLIGDNNFAALSAILFDLKEPKEIMETIFHDMLNRDEELKNATLRRLAEMKEHPLCEEAAELLDEEN